MAQQSASQAVPLGLQRRPTRPARPFCPPPRPPRSIPSSTRMRSPTSTVSSFRPSSCQFTPLNDPPSTLLTMADRAQLRARCLTPRGPLPSLPPPPPDVFIVDDILTTDPSPIQHCPPSVSTDDNTPSTSAAATDPSSSSPQHCATPSSSAVVILSSIPLPPSTPPPCIEHLLSSATGPSAVTPSVVESSVAVDASHLHPEQSSTSGNVDTASGPLLIPTASSAPPPPPLVAPSTSDIQSGDSAAADPRPRPTWRLIPLERTSDFSPDTLFPIRAHDVLTTLDIEPLLTPSQLAANLRARFALNRAQTATVRLMTSSAIAARHDLAATLRRVIGSGDADDPAQLLTVIRDLIVRLETHPRPQLGD